MDLGGTFGNQSNIKDGAFFENSWRLSTAIYLRKS